LSSPPGIPLLRHLGHRPYLPVWQEMQAFTDQRTASSADELWLVEHPAIFTVGLNGKPEHLLDPGTTPVLQVDRGGQVTWHGPGQAVLYLLIDLRRRGLGVRALVSIMEQAVIALLADHGISASAKPDAPGVYVAGAKVASLGLRVRRGCSYHGLALNVDPDLSAFTRINPCGHPGQAVTSLRQLGLKLDLPTAGEALAHHLLQQLALASQPVKGS